MRREAVCFQGIQLRGVLAPGNGARVARLDTSVIAEIFAADTAGSSQAGAAPHVAATALHLAADGPPHLGPRSETKEISDEPGAVYRTPTGAEAGAKSNVEKPGPRPFIRSIRLRALESSLRSRNTPQFSLGGAGGAREVALSQFGARVFAVHRSPSSGNGLTRLTKAVSAADVGSRIFNPGT